MRNYKTGAMFHQPFQRFLDQFLGAGIDIAGSFVQDHHWRVGHGCPGNGEQLALALIDLEHQILPDVMTYPAIVFGLVFSWFYLPNEGLLNGLLGLVGLGRGGRRLGRPLSATKNRPELAGKAFEATGVSLVLHPRNPYVPTTHANFRFFTAGKRKPVWWFGGGFDLTPYYPFNEDVLDWHAVAKAACDPFGEELYPRYKQWCDEYFYLKHRGETRGVGGLFFDDVNEPDFERSFAFVRSVGDSFLKGYKPIVERRIGHRFGDRQREFQQYRRGRYVEFNLLYDRGTLFGLQSGGRTESILMSLPPTVRWRYNWTPEPGSPEEKLYRDYLRPRDWLGEHAD